MKVLIAGGSGFLGTSLRKSLAKDGHDVFILTRRVSNQRESNSMGWKDNRWMGTYCQRNGCSG